MSEQRRTKFVTLAENRTNNAIKQIRLIGNLSNKGNYNYEEKDIAKIVSALNNEIKTMKERFASGGGSGKPNFTL